MGMYTQGNGNNIDSVWMGSHKTNVTTEYYIKNGTTHEFQVFVTEGVLKSTNTVGQLIIIFPNDNSLVAQGYPESKMDFVPEGEDVQTHMTVMMEDFFKNGLSNLN